MEFRINVRQYDKDRANGWFKGVNIVAQDVSVPEVLRRLAECYEAYVKEFGEPTRRPITREDVKRAIKAVRLESRGSDEEYAQVINEEANLRPLSDTPAAYDSYKPLPDYQYGSLIKKPELEE